MKLGGASHDNEDLWIDDASHVKPSPHFKLRPRPLASIRQSLEEDDVEVKEDSEELSENTDNTYGSGRYPKRVRVPTLRHWLNERMVYDLAGELLFTVKYDDTLGGLVKVGQRKRPNTNLRDEICGGLILASSKETEKLEKLLSDIKTDQVTKKEDVVFTEDSAFQVQTGTVNCTNALSIKWLKLKPYQQSKQFVASQDHIGLVLMSKTRGVKLTLDEEAYILSMWDNFSVPAGSSFSLKNTSKKSAVRVQLIANACS